MKFTTNFGSGTKKSSDFPKAVEAFDAIEPSSFDTSKQSQAEHTTMFNNSSCFSKSKKHSSRSSFCPKTSGDVSAKTYTKGGLKQISDSKLKETSKSKGHKISGLFKKAKAKVVAKNSSLKTRAKSVFGKLSTKSKSEPHAVPSSVNRTKIHSSLDSEDSTLSIPVPPKACVQNEVHSTSSTQAQGSPKSGDYWVQKMCGFAPKSGSGTMTTKDKKPTKSVSKVSATSKLPDEKKGSGFFGSSFLSPVLNSGEELTTKPQTSAFPALPSIFSFATNRNSVMVTASTSKPTQALEPEISSKVVATGASFFVGKVDSKPSCTTVEEASNSACIFGYTSCEAVDECFVDTEEVSLKIPLFGKKAQHGRFTIHSIFPLANVTGRLTSKPGIFSYFQKKWSFDEESWVSYTDVLRCAEGIPESKGEKDQISSHTMNDSETHVSKSSSTANPKMVGTNLNAEKANLNEDSRDASLHSTVKKSCGNSYTRFKSFVPSLEFVAETQAYLFPKGDRNV